MKKLLTILLLVIAINSQAQMKLINPGKVWSVRFDLYGSQPWIQDSLFYLYYFGPDTVISGYTYSILKRVDDTLTYNALTIGYMREDSTGKVFAIHTYNLLQEDLMYDFNALPGSTFSNVGLDFASSPAYDLHVDSINFTPIQTGEIRKHLFLTWLSGNWHVEWIEGIGSTSGLGMTGGSVTDVASYLLCFRDNDTLKYSKPGSPCYFSSVGINENPIITQEINIYPNPATNSLTIETPSLKIISLYDVLGNLCYTKQVSNSSSEKINVAFLNRGIYFLNVKTANGSCNRKVLLQ